jgi:peroxiredoxin
MYLTCVTASYASADDDRAAELARLMADYGAAEFTFLERELPENPTTADRIERYKSFPHWIYFPKLLALAEAEPNDPTALAACKWIVDRGDISISCRPMFEADQKAWRILSKHQLTEDDILTLSSRAVRRQSPASEAFLRDMASRTDLPDNARAFATTALAEFLARRSEFAEDGGFESLIGPPEQKEYLEWATTQMADGWITFASVTDPKPFRTESIALFRHVVDEYGDVPLADSALHATLGEKAEQHLYALEHLVIGAEAPDIEGVDLDGNPLRLSDYRGKVVVLSFWFTGCGPCIGALPSEKKLIEKFRGEPFALLGVCRDPDVAVSKKTADDHGMTWRSWFDKYPGRIVQKYNVTGCPRFYVLDAEGRIAARDVHHLKLGEVVEATLHSAADQGTR